MAKLSLEEVNELSVEYHEEEDESLDIRNLLKFSETAIGVKEIDGDLWQYQLRKTDFGIGEGLGREIAKLPIVSAELKQKIQQFKTTKAGKFGQVKLLPKKEFFNFFFRRKRKMLSKTKELYRRKLKGSNKECKNAH